MDSSGHGEPCETVCQDSGIELPSESQIELEESELYDEDEDEEDYLDETDDICPFVLSPENLEEIKTLEKYTEFWNDSCFGVDYNVQK
ncbi:MAG TPA: hypothetical protein VII94_03430 [Candidatus Saccharimonadales bacterium]